MSTTVIVTLIYRNFLHLQIIHPEPPVPQLDEATSTACHPKQPKQPKTKVKKNKGPAKKGTQSQKPTVGSVADLAQLGKEAQANVKQHIKAACTVKSYVDYIWRTREWFAPIAKSLATSSGESGSNKMHLDSDCFGGLDLTDQELQNALEDTPNKFTPWVIHIYVMKCCITNGLSLQMAHAIHAAWIDFYKT